MAEPVFNLDQLNRKYRPPLIAFFSRRVNNLTEAEDMTQEVFMRLMKAECQSENTQSAYIFQIAANLVRDRARYNHVRRKYAEVIRADMGTGIDPLDPHRITSARETIAALWTSIQTLPEPTQQIFILYRVENIPKQQIADAFGIHARTVDKHLAKALAFLSKKIERRP